jgi:hypothetical protein
MVQYPVAVFDYLIVSEPQDAPAVLIEEGVASVVIAGLRMLATVGFDHQPRFRTGKIDDIRRYHELSPEAPAQLATAQNTPERPLCVGCIDTQFPGALARLLTAAHIPFGIRHGIFGVVSAPTLTLPRKRGREFPRNALRSLPVVRRHVEHGDRLAEAFEG